MLPANIAENAMLGPAVGDLWHKQEGTRAHFICICRMNHRNIWTVEGPVSSSFEVHQYSRAQFSARLRIGGNIIDTRDNEPYWKVGKWNVTGNVADNSLCFCLVERNRADAQQWFNEALARKVFHEHWPA